MKTFLTSPRTRFERGATMVEFAGAIGILALTLVSLSGYITRYLSFNEEALIAESLNLGRYSFMPDFVHLSKDGIVQLSPNYATSATDFVSNTFIARNLVSAGDCDTHARMRAFSIRFTTPFPLDGDGNSDPTLSASILGGGIYSCNGIIKIPIDESASFPFGLPLDNPVINFIRSAAESVANTPVGKEAVNFIVYSEKYSKLGHVEIDLVRPAYKNSCDPKLGIC